LAPSCTRAPPPPTYANGLNIFNLLVFWGAWCSSCLRLRSASRNVAGSIPDYANELILAATLWSWCRLSFLQNRVPVIFPLGGGAGGGRWPGHRGENLTTLMWRMSTNSGSFNLLKPQGPVQADNGIRTTNRVSHSLVTVLCVYLNNRVYTPAAW